MKRTYENSDKMGNITEVVPDTMIYPNPKAGPGGSRKEARLSPLQGQYSVTTGMQGDNIIRFELNAADIIDFCRGGFAFDATLTTTGVSTYMRMAQGAWSMVYRLRILSGSTELEDIREYGRLHSILFELFREPAVGGVLGSVFGYGTEAQRNIWGATATKDYMLPLLAGLLISSPLPMSVFKKKLRLELWLDDPSKFVETDSNGPVTLTLTSLYLHYEVLQFMDPSMSTMMENAISNVRFPYKTYQFYITNLSNAIQDVLIPHASDAIDGFISIYTNTSQWSTMTINDKYLTWPYNNTQQFTLKVDNEFFPIEPVFAQNDPQAYLQYLRMINKWHLDGVYKEPPTISFEDFNNNRFIIINDLRMYPGTGLVNNFSTARSGNNLFERLQLQAAPPANTSLLTYAIVARTIDFRGGNLVQ